MFSISKFNFVSDREGLAEGEKVEQLNERILAALRDHVTYNPEAQKKPQYLTRVLEKLPFLRNLSQQAMQRIFYLRLVGLVPEPPILEKLFSSNIPFWTSPQIHPDKRSEPVSRFTRITIPDQYPKKQFRTTLQIHPDNRTEPVSRTTLITVLNKYTDTPW